MTKALEDAWLDFHRAHPEVAPTLAYLALDLKRRGAERLGIANLWEVLRYNTALGATTGEDTYKLNNNHRAYYARFLMRQWPELDGYFETRELTSA